MAGKKPLLATFNYPVTNSETKLFQLDENDVFVPVPGTATHTRLAINFNPRLCGMFFTGDLAELSSLISYGTFSGSGQPEVVALKTSDLSVHRWYTYPNDRHSCLILRKYGLFSPNVPDNTNDNLYYFVPSPTEQQVLTNYAGQLGLSDASTMWATFSEDDIYGVRVVAPTGTVPGTMILGVAIQFNTAKRYPSFNTTLQKSTIPTFPNGQIWSNDCLKFSYDHRRLFIAGFNNGTNNAYIDIVSHDTALSPPVSGTSTSADPLKWLNRTLENVGVPRCLIVHPSNEFIAVGFVALDNTATTKIYKIVNDKLVTHATLNGLGRYLAFTQDGKYLIDAVSHKAYTINGDVFTENLTMLANVPTTNMAMQALDRSVDTRVFGELYSTGAELLLKTDPATLDLRVKYLTYHAYFYPEHQTVSDVTNAGMFDIVDSDIPATGLQVTGVNSFKVDETKYLLRANNVGKIGFTTKAVRYALIYDDTTQTPICLINFRETLEWGLGTSINLPLSEGFVYYTKP